MTDLTRKTLPMLNRPLFRLLALPFTGFALALGLVIAAPGMASAQTITVHKTPWCGCCTAWVDHLKENGFDVDVREAQNLTPIRRELGVPDKLMSCHTGEVDGYTLEGHVPATEIRRLLAERPSVKGLSVPGMPMGSPGMETPRAPDTYNVVLFSENSEETYATYQGAERVDGSK